MPPEASLELRHPLLGQQMSPRSNLPAGHRSVSDSASSHQSLRYSVVFHQLDDLNALADALAMASREDDAERIATIRASMDRYALAIGWNVESALPAILAYLDEHSEFDDDLFGPAFILGAIAPERPETAALLARLPRTLCDLLVWFAKESSAAQVPRR